MGTCRVYDRSGDITFSWNEENDAEVAKIIQKKMDQGIRFFIVKPFGGEESPIGKISDITGREVKVHDEDFGKLLTDGRVGIFSRAASVVAGAISSVGTRTNRLITDANEAARSHTMAMRQPVGG